MILLLQRTRHLLRLWNLSIQSVDASKNVQASVVARSVMMCDTASDTMYYKYVI